MFTQAEIEILALEAESHFDKGYSEVSEFELDILDRLAFELL